MTELVHADAFEPANMADAMTLATTLRQSRLVPAGLQSPADVLVVLMTGRELGLPAMLSLRSIHVVDGRPTLSADVMHALAARSPACEYLRIVETTTERCVVETLRRGHPQPSRFVYTMEDASRAGLSGRGPWKKHPQAMLRARAISATCRAVYPDLLAGVYTPEEMGDEGRGPGVLLDVRADTFQYSEDATAGSVDTDTHAHVDRRVEALGVNPDDFRAFLVERGVGLGGGVEEYARMADHLESPDGRCAFDAWLDAVSGRLPGGAIKPMNAAAFLALLGDLGVHPDAFDAWRISREKLPVSEMVPIHRGNLAAQMLRDDGWRGELEAWAGGDAPAQAQGAT